MEIDFLASKCLSTIRPFGQRGKAVISGVKLNLITQTPNLQHFFEVGWGLHFFAFD